jgi:hypothetical protein
MHVILIANPLVIYVLNITLCRWKELYYYHFRSILEIYLRQSYSRVYFFCCFKCFSLEFEKVTMFCQNYHFMMHWYFLCQMYRSTFIRYIDVFMSVICNTYISCQCIYVFYVIFIDVFYVQCIDVFDIYQSILFHAKNFY